MARHADVVFDAGHQLRKVRFVMWLAVACAGAGAWWGWSLGQTYGLAPGDGGVLAPLPTRMAVGTTVAGLGLLFAAGMWLYGRQYIAEIRQGPAGDQLTVRTTHLVGTIARTYPASEVRLGRRHEGRAGVYSADNPFVRRHPGARPVAGRPRPGTPPPADSRRAGMGQGAPVSQELCNSDTRMVIRS